MQSQPFSLKDYPFAQTVRLVRSLQPTLGAPRRRLTLLLLVAIAGMIAPAFVPRGLLPPVALFHAPVFFAVVAGAAAYGLTMRRVSASWSASPALSGQPVVTIGPEGVTIEGKAGRSTVFWSAIRDMVPGPDGAVILTSGTGFIPLPSAAFASPAEADAFATALRARIPAVKEPF